MSGLTVDPLHAWLIGISLALIAIVVMFPKKIKNGYFTMIALLASAVVISWIVLFIASLKG